jgi:hypothetical protein
MNDLPDPPVVEAVSRLPGVRPRPGLGCWRRLHAGRAVVATFSDGSTAFAKVGTKDHIAEWLRIEHRAYTEIEGPFMPRMLGGPTVRYPRCCSKT